MEHGDAALCSDGPQGILELARFIHSLVDERLGDRLADRRHLAAAVAANEALDASKADTADLRRLLVEHGHSGLVKDSRDFLRLTALILLIRDDPADQHR